MTDWLTEHRAMLNHAAVENTQAEAKYVAWLERTANESKALSDGAIRIAFVKLDVFSPAIAECGDEFGTRYAIFDRMVLNAIVIAHAQQWRVRAQIRRASGHTWIYSAQLYPTPEDLLFPCVMCGRDVPRDPDGKFRCPSCHYVMEP